MDFTSLIDLNSVKTTCALTESFCGYEMLYERFRELKV